MNLLVFSVSSYEVSEIRKILENLEKRISAIEEKFRSAPKIVSKQISVKEFLLQKRPSGDIQKTLVIGYYLEKHKGLQGFTVKDLKEGFHEAKEKFPSNINREIRKNIEAGYVMETDQERENLKTWALTNSGEKFVESNLQGK